jgi:hypothetical protein
MSLSEAEYNLVLRFDEPELNQSRKWLASTGSKSPIKLEEGAPDVVAENIIGRLVEGPGRSVPGRKQRTLPYGLVGTKSF